jgi:hypothetical protein
VPLEETDLTTDEVELIDQMQVVIQFFLNLLQVTGGSCTREMCVVPYRTQVEKRCTSIIGKKSESSRDRNHIQCNRANIRDQEKGSESGTSYFRVPFDRRRNINST